MDIKAYIETGTLELYALGLLESVEKAEVESDLSAYPELAEELMKIEAAIENFAAAQAIEPASEMRLRIRKALLNDSAPLSEPIYPLIHAGSDLNHWMSLVREVIPARVQGEKSYHVLQQSEDMLQMLLVSDSDFEDELHDDMKESFFILDGSCKCTVGENAFYMGPGDYAEIPLHEMHRVEIISEPILAVLQRIKI